MNVLYQLVIRNTKLYLRDRAAVFFSFLSVIIILLLFIVFLGQSQIDNLTNRFGDIEGLDWLISSWIMAGILTVSTVTVPLMALGILVMDRQKGTINDFYTSPIDRKILALSYLMSSWIIGFIMVFFNMVIGLVYVNFKGGEFLSFIPLMQLIGVIILSIITFSSFFFYLSLFIKSPNAFGALSTIVGTFIGFFGGIYIPIGSFSKNVQTIMNILPSAHSVTLMRNIYMKGALDLVFQGDQTELYDNFIFAYGLEVKLSGFTMDSIHLVLSMIVFAIIFYALSVMKLSKTKL